MKRIIVVSFCLMMVLSLSACSDYETANLSSGFTPITQIYFSVDDITRDKLTGTIIEKYENYPQENPVYYDSLAIGEKYEIIADSYYFYSHSDEFEHYYKEISDNYEEIADNLGQEVSDWVFRIWAEEISNIVQKTIYVRKVTVLMFAFDEYYCEVEK